MTWIGGEAGLTTLINFVMNIYLAWTIPAQLCNTSRYCNPTSVTVITSQHNT